MNKFIKPKIILPMVLGIIIGGLLFAFGEYDDAPGLCAIGLSFGFILIMLGIKNAGVIKKGWFVPILMFFFAAFIALITTSILLDGEYGAKPWHSIFGYITAVVLLLIGLLIIRKARKSK